jgi:hypothetical protein
MVLRYICGEECWQPNAAQATMIVDDPLLRKDYGFLNFARQLELMDQYNFHTSVAFIPYNCHRTSSATALLFRERPDRLSICFHGNDHTDAEFATSDPHLLTAMLHEAERRMHSHGKETGISCDRVMVFPQGKFSLAAIKALKAHNFCAAVNTEVGVADEPARLALADAISPSVLKYEGFPLFLRKYVRNFSSGDIAFNAFFGKPVFIVEHHEIFKNPEVLTDLIARINFLLPGIRWTNLQTALENSSIKRRSPDGSYRIRAYSSVCLVDNPADTTIEGCVEWPGQAGFCRENVGVEAQTGLASQAKGQSSAVCFTLAAGQSRKFSSVCHNEFGHFQVNHKVSSEVKTFLRRRFSELRDNHLSKTPRVLALAESLNRRLLKGPRSSHLAARD